MSWWTTLLCSLGLIACQGSNPSPGVVTIADPMSYLVRTVADHRQTATDPLGPRRYDLGHYQETDAFALDATHAVTTWDYPAFGSFDAGEGDGGEQYVVEGDPGGVQTVRIEGTRDGGTLATQYFVGAACGGTGWLVFRSDADSSWREVNARLNITDNPGTCPQNLNAALTRYSKQTVTFPTLGAREAVISEHYSGSVNADTVERSIFVEGLGRVVWQALSRQPSPIAPDELARRCPDFGWSSLGDRHVIDCRISEQTTEIPSIITGNSMWTLGK